MTPGRTWVNFMLPFKAVGRPEESRTPKPLSERQHLKLVCLPIPPQDGVLRKSKCRVSWAKPKCLWSRRIAQICKQISLRASAISVGSASGSRTHMHRLRTGNPAIE